MNIKKDILTNVVIYSTKAINNLFILFVASRVVEPNDYAAFLYNISFMLLVSNVCDMGFRLKVFKDFSLGNSISKYYYLKGIILKVILFIIFLLYALFLDSSIGHEFLILCIISGFFISHFNYNLVFLNAIVSFKYERNVSLLYSTLLLSSFLIYFFIDDIYWLYTCFVFASFLAYLLSIRYLSNLSFSIDKTSNFFLDLLPFTIHVYLSVLLGVFDNIFLESLLSPADFIVFSAAIKVVYGTYLITAVMTAVLSPRIAKYCIEFNFKLIVQSYCATLFFALLISTIYLLLSDYINVLLFSAYSSVIDFSTIKYLIALTIMVKICSVVPGLVSTMSGRQWSRVMVLVVVVLLGYSAYYFTASYFSVEYVYSVFFAMSLLIFLCYNFIMLRFLKNSVHPKKL